MTDRQFHPETLAIHAGQIPHAATGARASLIDPASAVVGGTEAFRPWAQSLNMAA
jgi:O-acetylhomoserine/O-acetylserine sulfhydrylase-like pyridoxal-dependent enzyme